MAFRSHGIVAWGLLASATCLAQELDVSVLSELRRVGPDGEIAGPDRLGRPREIISPAAVRSGFTSFFVVVRTPRNKPFTVFLGENPNGAVVAWLYRVHFKGGFPDRLERVLLPVNGTAAEGVAVYWLDLYVPPRAEVRRIRVELQVNVGEEWRIEPLEIRIQSASVPRPLLLKGELAGHDQPSSSTAFSTLRTWMCGETVKATGEGDHVRSFIRRNASQDLAILRKLAAGKPDAEWKDKVASVLGASTASAWCGLPAPADPEAYLRVRDLAYRSAVD